MAVARQRFGWVPPMSVAVGLRRRQDLVALVAGAQDAGLHGGRWSFVAIEPDRVQVVDTAADGALFEPLRQEVWSGPPVVGLASYDAGARTATGPRPLIWPDLMLARYVAWLAFDHVERIVWACGWGADEAAAAAASDRAAAWLATARSPSMPQPPAETFASEAPVDRYKNAVAEVVERIASGELFQANIARGWSGTLRQSAAPFDVFLRLGARGAAYGAYWRVGNRALVSNSPELFLTFDEASRRLETRPIKGTRPRHADAPRNQAAADELLASAKDRAENLMIVDLMRNDLARVSDAGSVTVDRLCGLESHPTVHHLTSVVSSRARADVTWADVLDACFPPGSITGAPKHQAMKVIADFEPSRGAWCGTLFVRNMGPEAGAVASVLIRTASLELSDGQWHWRALAGAGITADSDPDGEAKETAAKIRALAEALAGRTVEAAD